MDAWRGFYSGRRVLVTGHTGFKGAWLCEMLLRLGAVVHGFALPPPTRTALFDLLGLAGRVRSVLGDIRDLPALEAAFRRARPQVVFHLAAQPIVRAGYRDPVGTYGANVMGTVNVLDCVRRCQHCRSLLVVTTDKVYRNAEQGRPCREDDPLDGYDPYASSKSCAELAVACYRRSFFADGAVAVSTARAGNVVGGGDFAPDRIVPDCARAAAAGRPVVLRNPDSVRPYQGVLDALRGYLLIAARQSAAPALSGCYNLGPAEGDALTTREIAEAFIGAWGDGATYVVRREHDAPREAALLTLDSARARDTLGWRPLLTAHQAVAQAAHWYRRWRDGADLARLTERLLAENPGLS